MSKTIDSAFVTFDEDTLDTVAGGGGEGAGGGLGVSVLNGLNLGGILNGSANGNSTGSGNKTGIPVLSGILNGLGISVG